MSRVPFRVVLDTNILVRALIDIRSASGTALRACERRLVVPLLSKPLLAEYRAILTDPRIVERYPELEARKVKVALERLSYVGVVVRRVAVRFDFPRDPKDAKLIELAIAGRATHLVKTDRDLLDLPRGPGDAPRRFRQRLPTIEVVRPEPFVHAFESGIEDETDPTE